jgi:hypothetical protein
MTEMAELRQGRVDAIIAGALFSVVVVSETIS